MADRRSLATPKRKARLVPPKRRSREGGRRDHRLSTLAYRPLTSSLLTPPCSLSLKPSAASPQPPSLSLLMVRPALARSSSPEPCMSIAIAPTLPSSPSTAARLSIPCWKPNVGLAGVNLHTYSGWGSVTYWNAYVANTQMHGKGTFFDPRLNDKAKFPVAVRAGFHNVRNTPDLITPKLAALHYYQLSIPAPKPPAGSFDQAAAARGEAVFNGIGKCSTCHVPPLFTEPGWSMHTAKEIGIDEFQSDRSPDKRYRTTPLSGLFARQKGGFYHDGRFQTYQAVIDHYNEHLNLRLTDQQKNDLAEYLKSL